MTMTIHGTTVPDPSSKSIEYLSNSSAARSANGTLHVDYYNTTLYRKIKLEWKLVTSSERSTLLTILADCISNTRTIVLSDGETFSVRLDPDSAITDLTVRSGSVYLYNLAATFIGV